MYPTKRDYTWLFNKDDSPLPLLEDGTQVSLPRDIGTQIVPTFDALGWDRAEKAGVQAFSGAGLGILVSTAVPAERIRFIFDVQVQTSEAATAHHLFIDHRVALDGLDVALMIPFLNPVGAANLHVSPGRTVIMAPFDQIVFRAVPAIVGPATLAGRYRFVDIPVGEYIPPR